MDTTTRLAIFIPAWIAVGLITALVMRRRGHDLTVWAAIGTAFGPFTIPLAFQQVRRALWMVRPQQVSPGRPSPGHLDVLVGVDGSEQACAAARAVVERFGPTIQRLTLAAVMDVDESVSRQDPYSSQMWERDHRHEDACRQQLDAVVRQLPDVEPETVILAGDPAMVLARYAEDNGYDFLVVGPRGRGASKAILGSVARRLPRKSTVPVIIGPPNEEGPLPTGAPGSTSRHLEHADR